MGDNMCTRRHAMARAAGLAAGLALSTVNAPGFAAETKSVKMGSDSGQLVFVPDEIKICKGDTVTWINNKGGPHNVVFDEEAIPSGVDAEAISMDDQLGDEGATYSKKFDVAGKYSYYCEAHRGGHGRRDGCRVSSFNYGPKAILLSCGLLCSMADVWRVMHDACVHRTVQGGRVNDAEGSASPGAAR